VLNSVHHQNITRNERNRMTDHTVSTAELSRRLREHYRRIAERKGIASEYDRWVTAVWPELAKLEGKAANAAWVLHVLVCTRLGKVVPGVQTLPALAELPRRQRGALLRAVRTLRALGRERVEGLFGPADSDWGRAFYSGLGYLEQELSGGTYETPAFQVVGWRGRAGPRRRELFRTACIVCLMSELKRQPKPAAWVATLLEKFDFLPPGRGNPADRVKKRYQRDARKAADPQTVLGNVVDLLRTTFRMLREHLAPEPVEPVPLHVLRQKAKRWGVSLEKFSRGFEDFCQLHRLTPDRPGLKEYEVALRGEKNW